MPTSSLPARRDPSSRVQPEVDAHAASRWHQETQHCKSGCRRGLRVRPHAGQVEASVSLHPGQMGEQQRGDGERLALSSGDAAAPHPRHFVMSCLARTKQLRITKRQSAASADTLASAGLSLKSIVFFSLTKHAEKQWPA